MSLNPSKITDGIISLSQKKRKKKNKRKKRKHILVSLKKFNLIYKTKKKVE